MSVPVLPEKLTLEDALSSARETRSLTLGSRVVDETGRVFSEQFPTSCRAVIGADERTFRVAGGAVEGVLAQAGVTQIAPFIFSDPSLYAEFRFVKQLEDALRRHDAIPIAVGSGTINDLTKLAAHRIGRPSYLSVVPAA